MSADNILQRLDKVKKTGTGKWSARCPAHEDKGPSLAIKETDDGRVLLHCFAGCSVGEIVDSLGISLSDLFPPRPLDGHAIKPMRKPWNASDVLNALAFEVLLAFGYAKQMASGQPLSEPDLDRLLQIAARLQSGLGVINA
jgi:hypothetical protein